MLTLVYIQLPHICVLILLLYMCPHTAAICVACSLLSVVKVIVVCLAEEELVTLVCLAEARWQHIYARLAHWISDEDTADTGGGGESRFFGGGGTSGTRKRRRRGKLAGGEWKLEEECMREEDSRRALERRALQEECSREEPSIRQEPQTHNRLEHCNREDAGPVREEGWGREERRNREEEGTREEEAKPPSESGRERASEREREREREWKEIVLGLRQLASVVRYADGRSHLIKQRLPREQRGSGQRMGEEKDLMLDSAWKDLKLDSAWRYRCVAWPY